MGVDLVSLANNHVCDYGVDGLLDTMRILNESKVAYIGAGKDLSDLKTTQYYIMGGRKIAIISATQIERSYTYTKQATVNSPGVLKTQTENYVRNAIAAAKAKSDYVIVYIHWGSEGTL